MSVTEKTNFGFMHSFVSSPVHTPDLLSQLWGQPGFHRHFVRTWTVSSVFMQLLWLPDPGPCLEGSCEASFLPFRSSILSFHRRTRQGLRPITNFPAQLPLNSSQPGKRTPAIWNSSPPSPEKVTLSCFLQSQCLMSEILPSDLPTDGDLPGLCATHTGCQAIN